MTKKQKKEKDKLNRVYFDMPLGTIVHKDKKHPSRETRKIFERKEIDLYV